MYKNKILESVLTSLKTQVSCLKIQVSSIYTLFKKIIRIAKEKKRICLKQILTSMLF
jgi:hypothetical protein